MPDLSHPPNAIPALIDRLRNGADFGFGSRYVKKAARLILIMGNVPLAQQQSGHAAGTAVHVGRGSDERAFFALRRQDFT